MQHFETEILEYRRFPLFADGARPENAVHALATEQDTLGGIPIRPRIGVRGGNFLNIGLGDQMDRRRPSLIIQGTQYHKNQSNQLYYKVP